MRKDKITIDPWEDWADNDTVVSAFRWVNREDAKGNVDSKRISVRVSKRGDGHLIEVYDLNRDRGIAKQCNGFGELLNEIEKEMSFFKEEWE